MRKVIWSPKTIQDYAAIIDYLLSAWTIKEAAITKPILIVKITNDTSR
jgi:plasmid stabilization system protein ParE